MRIVVFGAAGSIGTAITAELIHRGHDVTGVTRSGRASVAGAHTTTGDAADPQAVALLASGADAVVSAIGPRHDGSEDPLILATTTRSLIDGVRAAGVTRLVAVGGAGSLLDATGAQHVDNPHFPEAVKPIALAHAATLDIYRDTHDLKWTYISPAASIEPGERTGQFRIGGDTLLTDKRGVSRITIPDYAIGLVDQIEKPTAIRTRITLAY
ncbi:NAD(P)H-binding protein [Streptomyces sp. NPDC005708]|uniref:NAD(P)-dependent oxidoreductase n=1 Tax=Streptomyces sp. NPDC005708 TaxID=3154564 RepID=UPI0033D305A8